MSFIERLISGEPIAFEVGRILPGPIDCRIVKNVAETVVSYGPHPITLQTAYYGLQHSTFKSTSTTFNKNFIAGMFVFAPCCGKVHFVHKSALASWEHLTAVLQSEVKVIMADKTEFILTTYYEFPAVFRHSCNDATLNVSFFKFNIGQERCLSPPEINTDGTSASNMTIAEIWNSVPILQTNRPVFPGFEATLKYKKMSSRSWETNADLAKCDCQYECTKSCYEDNVIQKLVYRERNWVSVDFTINATALAALQRTKRPTTQSEVAELEQSKAAKNKELADRIQSLLAQPGNTFSRADLQACLMSESHAEYRKKSILNRLYCQTSESKAVEPFDLDLTHDERVLFESQDQTRIKLIKQWKTTLVDTRRSDVDFEEASKLQSLQSESPEEAMQKQRTQALWQAWCNERLSKKLEELGNFSTPVAQAVPNCFEPGNEYKAWYRKDIQRLATLAWKNTKEEASPFPSMHSASLDFILQNMPELQVFWKRSEADRLEALQVFHSTAPEEEQLSARERLLWEAMKAKPSGEVAEAGSAAPKGGSGRGGSKRKT